MAETWKWAAPTLGVSFYSKSVNIPQVPDTCCKTVSPQCGVRDHPSNVYYTGCAHKLARLARDHLILIGSIAIVICLVQAVGVFLGVKLVNKLKTVGD